MGRNSHPPKQAGVPCACALFAWRLVCVAPRKDRLASPWVMAFVAPPVDFVRPVSPYPEGLAAGPHTKPIKLSEGLIPAGKPFVLHLYTG